MLHTMLFQSNLSMRGSFSVESGRKPHRDFLRIRRRRKRYMPVFSQSRRAAVCGGPVFIYVL